LAVAGSLSVVLVVVAVLVAGFSVDTRGRTQLWIDSLELAVARPLGVGFGDLYGNIPLTVWAESTGVTQYSHNVLLEAAVEGGWIALLGLVGVLLLSARSLLRGVGANGGRLLLALWVYALVNAMFSSDLVGNRLVWVSVGAGFALMLKEQMDAAQHAKHSTTTGAATA